MEPWVVSRQVNRIVHLPHRRGATFLFPTPILCFQRCSPSVPLPPRETGILGIFPSRIPPRTPHLFLCPREMRGTEGNMGHRLCSLTVNP